MKANELMIWDWVYGCTDPYDPDEEQKKYPVKVIRIDADGDTYTMGDRPSDDPYEDEWWNLEPIPITPEILEKNGFKARGYEELVLETDEYCFALQKGVDGRNAWWWEMFSSPIIPINYVHELQHALRLCGIEKEIVL